MHEGSMFFCKQLESFPLPLGNSSQKISFWSEDKIFHWHKLLFVLKDITSNWIIIGPSCTSWKILSFWFEWNHERSLMKHLWILTYRITWGSASNARVNKEAVVGFGTNQKCLVCLIILSCTIKEKGYNRKVPGHW